MAPIELARQPVTLQVTVVHAAGELDGSNVEHLRSYVRAVEPGSTTIILDLHDLVFMDSMGIGAIVQLHHELDAQARLLQVRNLTGQPRRVLELTQVDGFLNLV